MAAQGDFEFTLARPAEVIAELELSSPGADWAVAGREAAVADVLLNGTLSQQVMLFAGQERYAYSVFLGPLPPGKHTVRVQRNHRHSARGAGLEAYGARFLPVEPESPQYAVVAHAPVLYAREDTIGRFSDTPLVVYCERLREQGADVLQYTVVFSNEDGGTSTRALMARWGRTTDIEYVYRCFLDRAGKCARATIQAKDHKDVDFDGQRLGQHPLLTPVTRNNMLAGRPATALRYQLAPIEIQPGVHSRETVMDLRPMAWTVMAKELRREGKLRPFGVVEEEKISDPRNYLYLDAKLKVSDGAFDFLVRLRGERLWRSSSLGRPDYAIARDGWIRTAVELPPGTPLDAIEELGFACRVPPPARGAPYAVAGTCRLEEFGGAFLLDQAGLPGPRLTAKASFLIPSGQMETLRLR
jgi:hypothetical protein